MFVGQLGCCLPLLYTHFTIPVNNSNAIAPEASLLTRILARLPLRTTPANDYTQVPGDENGEAVVVELNDTLRGWRVCWMWFPVFFDSE